MNFERLILKIRWDRPSTAIHKLIDRLARQRAIPRRRARWQHAPSVVTPADLPSDFSPAAATRLWPGAADRAWLADAAARWPALHASAASRAAAAAAGHFDLLGSGETDVQTPDGRVRWHDDFKANAAFPADRLYLDVPICLKEEGTDIKVPWELSRFQHVFTWLWSDPERYRDDFLRQWDDWLQANPVARGVNWACAMDVALRAISWTAALAAWGPTWDPLALRRMGAALATHGHFIRDNLEWISGTRTNHYFSDVVGLAVLGAVLPGYAPADDWARWAAAQLRTEILQQFAPDGFDRECSTAYHGLMLELAVLGLLAARVAGHDLGPAARERLAAAARALVTLSDSAGHVPLIGDNDSGRIFPLAEREDTHLRPLASLTACALDTPDLAADDATPEMALLCGPTVLDRARPTASAERPEVARALPDSGLFVLGRGRDHMVVRCGPLTYPASGSHKHIDHLSFALSVAGQQLLVDSGQFCYTPWPEWRNRFIVSQAHNTVIIDDQPQCRMFILGRMPYSIIDEAGPRCTVWDVGAEHARFVGRHRGYRRLPGGADHERTVEYSAPQHCWTITDRLPLRGSHRVQWRFHLHPAAAGQRHADGWQLVRGTSRLLLRCADDPGLTSRVEPGWYAPAYGRRVATFVVVYELASTGPVTRQFVLQAQDSA